MNKLKHIPVILLSILCILVMATVVVAQEEVPDPYKGMKSPFAWTNTSARTAGKSVYLKQCFSCHGDRGNEITEVDFSTAEFRISLESRPDFFFWKVSEGVPGTEMKAWKSVVSETQRWQALSYIWSLSSAAAALPALPAIPVAPVGGNTTAAAVPGVNATPAGSGAPEILATPNEPATPGANVTPGIPATPPPAVGSGTVIIPGRADIGENLFTGKTVLTNRGPACISCHNDAAVGLLGGGTMAIDLTTAYGMYGSEAGLISFLQKLRTPTMKITFGEKPLTDSENRDIVRFLKETGSTQLTSTRNAVKFFLAGAAGALLLIVLFQLLMRQRISGVRRRLVKGGSK